MGKRLKRSKKERMIAGVCGGLAAYYRLETSTVRIGFVLGSVFSVGAGVLVYLVLWLTLPDR